MLEANIRESGVNSPDNQEAAEAGASNNDSKEEFYEFENPNFRGSGGDGQDFKKENEMPMLMESLNISYISK